VKGTPLLTKDEWGLFAGFVLALVGIAIVSPRIATIVGSGVIVVLVIKNSQKLGLGAP
jgi:hypothetical protein